MRTDVSSRFDMDSVPPIEWVEKILDQVRYDIYSNLIKIAQGKKKVPLYKINREDYPAIITDDRIVLPKGREELLKSCLILLVNKRDPALSDESASFFLQMNFKGFGDKPNERRKLEYNMKPTHLIYFFRLVFNAVYKHSGSNSEIKLFREAVVQSFVGFDTVKHDTIITYFNKSRPAIVKEFESKIKRLSAEYR